ncbi:MAG: hypothetical protein IJG45_03740 [Oscillospiraceae bacterium]|nr:hypothetical protein [Oscillospiraceae bacterium]
MNEELLEQWAKLYHFTREISELEPWERLTEEDALVYAQKEKGKELVFSVLGNACPFCGIACYPSWAAYSRARLRLRGKNGRQEPLFMLQDAMIGIWGARKDVSKDNYEIIKALGLRGHGDGSWLHFEKYEEGFYPATLSEVEVEELADAMGNLYMMMRAIYENRLPDFKPGMMLLRWYDEKTKLYMTHPFPMQKLAIPSYPVVHIKENDYFQSTAALPTVAYTLSLDWSYLPFTAKDGGREFFPKLLLGINQEEIILCSDLLSPNQSRVNIVFNAIEQLFRSAGKPNAIRVCDRELEAILSEFCHKLGIRLNYMKTLPALNRVRKMFIDHMTR